MVLGRRGTGPPSSFGLRAKSTLAAALAALIVSVALSVITYVLVRGYLLHQREQTTARQTFNNARVVRDVLRADSPDLSQLLAALRSEPGGFALVRWQQAWYSTAVGEGPEALPGALLDAADGGESGRERYTDHGEPRLAVVVAIPAVAADYVEVFPLDELERTLGALRTSLVIAALVTTAGGAFLGWWTTRRVLRPLTTAADAAATIAAGDLGARLTPSGDADLDRLARAFEAMAVSLQERIEREARFASDVSHELRTPLAALAAAAEVLDRRRDEIPERTRQALDILLSQLRRFDQITLDLLEISKAQATVEDLDLQDVAPAPFTQRVAAALGFGDVPVDRDGSADLGTVRTDPRVLGAVLRNLLRNAEVHAGGATRIEIAGDDTMVAIAVEDAGAGIPTVDRLRDLRALRPRSRRRPASRERARPRPRGRARAAPGRAGLGGGRGRRRRSLRRRAADRGSGVRPTPSSRNVVIAHRRRDRRGRDARGVRRTEQRFRPHRRRRHPVRTRRDVIVATSPVDHGCRGTTRREPLLRARRRARADHPRAAVPRVPG